MSESNQINKHQESSPPANVKEDADTLLFKVNQYGEDKVSKSPRQSFILSIFAGAFISIAFVFYISVTTGNTQGWGTLRFVGGLAFSLGLGLVMVAGGELFTSAVLTVVAHANKRISFAQQLQCWGRIYTGNMIGALLLVMLIMFARLFELNGGQWGLNVLNIAHHKIHHLWSQAFMLGMLCNILVCLGIWMTFATKDVLTKVLLVILPVAMFVASGFEHSIANLFVVPLAISIQTFAPDSFFIGLNIPADKFSDLTFSNFIFDNLIPVTLGNVVGGSIVGLGYWLVENGGSERSVSDSQRKACSSSSSITSKPNSKPN